MSVALEGPVCGCLGCTDPATAQIEHPTHGQLVVCDDCAEGFVVIGHV